MKKELIFCLAFLTLSFSTGGTGWAVKNELQLQPGAGKQAIELPFRYSHLQAAQRDSLQYLPENLYTTLSDKEPFKAVVGPLQPCIFVGIRNEENGKAVVFHRQACNSLSSLIQITQKELEVHPGASSNLRAVLFSSVTEQNFKNPAYTAILKQIHNGKTQKEEMAHIKEILATQLGMEKKKIKEYFFVSQNPDEFLGDYELAELFVITDAKLNLSNFCPMHENFFHPSLYKLPLAQRLQTTQRLISKKTAELIQKHFGQSQMDIAQKGYDKVEFKKL